MFLRFLEEADVAEFIRLRLEALQTDPAAFGSSWEEERDRTPEMVAPRLRPVPDGNFLVGAFQGSTLIGIAGFVRQTHLKTRHKGSVWGVYVTPSARGAGVARALLTHLIERARGYDDLEQIQLTVTTCQEPARHLYTALGFEIFGYEPNALKLGARYADEEHRVLSLRKKDSKSGTEPEP